MMFSFKSHLQEVLLMELVAQSQEWICPFSALRKGGLQRSPDSAAVLGLEE
jgi:hypothetical protein